MSTLSLSGCKSLEQMKADRNLKEDNRVTSYQDKVMSEAFYRSNDDRVYAYNGGLLIVGKPSHRFSELKVPEHIEPYKQQRFGKLESVSMYVEKAKERGNKVVIYKPQLAQKILSRFKQHEFLANHGYVIRNAYPIAIEFSEQGEVVSIMGRQLAMSKASMSTNYELYDQMVLVLDNMAYKMQMEIPNSLFEEFKIREL